MTVNSLFGTKLLKIAPKIVAEPNSVGAINRFVTDFAPLVKQSLTEQLLAIKRIELIIGLIK